MRTNFKNILSNWAIGIDMYTVMCIKLMTDLKKKKY